MKRILAAVALSICYPFAAQAATLTVRSSGGTYTLSQFQTALNAAVCGDIIEIEAGQEVVASGSPFTLPLKNCQANPITITTSAALANLPGAGVRTGPRYAPYLARIRQANQGVSVLVAADGTNGWILRHLEVPNSPRGYGDLIVLGDPLGGFDSLEPHHITITQCWIHGDDVQGQKRGINLAGRDITITHSYFNNFTGIGQDAMPVSVINGTGNYLIENNFMEAGGYGFMSGGGDPRNRTHMVITGSPSLAGAAVDTTEAGHALAELTPRIGRPIAIKTPSGMRYSNLASVSGSGVSGSITWSPAIDVAPIVGNEVRYDTVPKNVQFLRNHVTKDLTWQSGIIPKPDAPTANTTPTGTVAAGSYYYYLQAFNNLSYTNQTAYSDTSDPVNPTLASPGLVTLSFSLSSLANGVRIWRCTSTTTTSCSRRDVTPNVSSFIDDGSGTWTAATRPTAGTRWIVKAVFEFKVGDTFLIAGNIFENNWGGDGGDGTSLWLKSVNQEGKCWGCYTQDIIIEHNIIRHTPAWLNLSSREVPQASGYERPKAITNLTIRNNLIYDCGGHYFGAVPARQAAQAGPVIGFTMEHNTMACESSIHPSNWYAFTDGNTSKGVSVNWVVRYNIGFKNRYGLLGKGEGKSTLDMFAPQSYTFTQNVVADANCSVYPATTICPSSATLKSYFVDYGNDVDSGDFNLRGSTPLDGAAPGSRDIGVDMVALLAAQGGGGGGSVTPPD